ncbi:Guanyl-specific ribonuclease F1 [Colletotrichum sidae]|uniref:Guanyl-specific ribonuclease F1 n=2 Tax=Colletotrichum orbiculare species complex TaxID=2707354 RepID=N4VJF4_COLOR|nr:Guanyl-specific ribonuclease F1 [Colletotrichum orbiculare MAFF 240422]TEA12772.1 Guanyl-specific ribonuclease F1 [Colletotrichum sidae]
MISLKSTLLLALCAFATASPLPEQTLQRRQGSSDNIQPVDCGGERYSRRQLEEATAEGCRLYANSLQVGTSQYPHRFNNREGLIFASTGPFQEFPIIPSGNYSGRAPGPDRVVFDPDYRGRCSYVGAMTHTGADQRNGFVTCNETRRGGSGSSAAVSISPSGPLGVLLPLLSFMAFIA